MTPSLCSSISFDQIWWARPPATLCDALHPLGFGLPCRRRGSGVAPLAHAAFRLYCVRNNHVQSVKLGPRLLGDAPKVNVFIPENEMAEEDGSSSEVSPAIKIYDDDINMKFLLCGVPRLLFAGLIRTWSECSIIIEIPGSKLQNRISASPPPLEAASIPRGMVTMRCDMTTCRSSHVLLLVSGSAQTCFDDQVVTKFLTMESLLDESVDKEINLQIERGGTPLTVTLKVKDLYSITPNHFLELSGVVIHPLSYQQDDLKDPEEVEDRREEGTRSFIYH
ncbi:hypothetical protein ZWY2020_040180 [Hordeum vulgare]|nr:hypothetical protein ZWY2020_040180 [Hordeum vulgare]